MTELQRLIRSQAHDAHEHRVRSRRAGLQCATDLALDFDALPARDLLDFEGLVGTGRLWTARETQYDPAAGPCPACGGHRGHITLRGRQVCAVCSVSRDQPQQYPQQIVVRVRAPKARKTKKAHHLAGGLGKLH